MTIKSPGAVTIQVTSAGATVSYTELEAKKPLLKAMDNTTRNYQEAEDFCKENKASLPTQKILEDILAARKPEVVAWAEKTFKLTGKQELVIWLKAETTTETSRPSINLSTGKYQGSTQEKEPYFNICQFNS